MLAILVTTVTKEQDRWNTRSNKWIKDTIKMTLNKLKRHSLPFVLGIAGCLFGQAAVANEPTKILGTSAKFIIDAKADEAIWNKLAWRQLDQVLIGQDLDPNDFSGRYKLTWNEDALYLLIEVTDDVLADTHPDPTVQYWDDDCVEVFVDQDASGGDHLNDYNAFAYHVGLDRLVSDIGPYEKGGQAFAQTYNSHVNSQWTRLETNANTVIWELEIFTYDDSFMPADKNTKPSVLKEGQALGFMLAYCDADLSGSREHFIGSYPIKGINGDKNLGYKTADVFEKVQLVK